MRIMGLDVGEKRIGVAVSDPLGITAQGICVVHSKGTARNVQALRELIKEYEVTRLVLGMPRNMNGTYGPKAQEVQDFGETLHKELNLQVEYQDERLSTHAVEGALIEADVSRQKRRQVIDKLAAVYILQGYLDKQANSSKRVHD